MKQKIRNTLLLTTLTLTACGDNRPPEEIVKERALSRWEIRKNGTSEGLYDYLSPAKRQIISEDAYKSQFGNSITYTDATVKDVVCASTGGEIVENCEVKIFIKFELRQPFKTSSSTLLTETWVKEDGQWWIAE